MESEAEPLALSSLDKNFLEQLYHKLDEHISDSGFNASQLASEMNMSYSRFYARVKLLTGQSPLNLLNTYRMNIAREMLLSHKYSVSEVCEHINASSLGNFSRAFKHMFGVPPSEI